MTQLSWRAHVDSFITGMTGKSITVVCKMSEPYGL